MLTVSLHKHEPGFFPVDAGALTEIGQAWGRGYNINVPLHHGIDDTQYVSLFSRLLAKINATFRPQVFVVQCGADTLFADPMKSFNLTGTTIVACIEQLIESNKPMLLLGGGGYNIADTARLWTSIIAVCLQTKLDQDIPEHDFFSSYGPDFTLATWPGNRTNKNTAKYLDDVLEYIERNQIGALRCQLDR